MQENRSFDHSAKGRNLLEDLSGYRNGTNSGRYETTIFIIDSYLQVQRSARIYLVNGRGGEALAIPAHRSVLVLVFLHGCGKKTLRNAEICALFVTELLQVSFCLLAVVREMVSALLTE